MLNTDLCRRALTGTLLALSLSSVGAAASDAPAGVLLDGIAAIVNEDVILLSELDVSVDEVRAQIAASGSMAPPDAVLRQQVLERLIVQELQVQMARRAGVQIPDDLLNQTLGRIAERNGITLNQLPDVLAQQGVDYRRYRDQLRTEMMIEQVRRAEVDATVYVSPEEIASFLAQQGGTDQDIEYNLSHILLVLPATADDATAREALRRAQGLVEQARGGADFAQLAVANSQGQRALQGGDMGWRRRDQLPGPFVEALDALQPGQVSDPIRSPSGLHILKLDDRREGQAVLVTQSRIRHVLVQPNAIMTSTDAEAALRTLRDDIIAGEVSFEDAARQYSDDPVSSSRGGDLGWNSPGNFVPEFDAMISETPVGTISEPFQSQFGWHILEVLERRQHDGTEEFRENEARNALYQQKVEEATQLWMQQLRDEAYVETRI